MAPPLAVSLPKPVEVGVAEGVPEGEEWVKIRSTSSNPTVEHHPNHLFLDPALPQEFPVCLPPLHRTTPVEDLKFTIA